MAERERQGEANGGLLTIAVDPDVLGLDLSALVELEVGVDETCFQTSRGKTEQDERRGGQ